MNILQKLGYGGQVMLIGLMIVFAVLVILIAIITALSSAIRSAEEKAKKPAPAKPAAPSAPAAPRAAEPAPAVTAQDDPELIAVIAAALAAYDKSGRLVVRSVRRVPGWKNANRTEQVYHF